MIKAPTAVLVCATVMFCVTLTGVVVLTLAHADFAEFRTTLNTILNIVTAASGISGMVLAGAASHTANQVRDQMTTPETPPPTGPPR